MTANPVEQPSSNTNQECNEQPQKRAIPQRDWWPAWRAKKQQYQAKPHYPWQIEIYKN